MKIITLCIGFYLICFQIKAQQNLINLNKYPKSILIKMFEISQKVTLSNEKQRDLAEIYFNRENELSQSLINKASREDIEAIKSKYETIIRKGLTAEEVELLNKPEYVNDGLLHITTSKFYAAYKLSVELKLTKLQIDSVLASGIRFEQSLANFKSKTVGDKFDAQGYENKELPKILDEKQFNYLFTIKFKDIATNQAIIDWNEAKKRGLTTGLDSIIIVPEMIKYTMERRGIGERFKSDPQKRNTLYGIIDESTPEMLKKLKYARQYGNPLDDKGNVSKSSY